MTDERLIDEIKEPRISDTPECWNLPDKAKYWTCQGKRLDHPKKRWPWSKEPEWIPRDERYIYMYYSKEDAEAHATFPIFVWKWNGLPAVETSLAVTMFEARVDGLGGVIVISFINGRWTTVKKYEAGEPLPEDLR